MLASSGTDLEPINVGGRYRFDRRVLLDSERFEALVTEAHALTDVHPRQARDLLDAALQLWRGDPYDGQDLEPLMPGLIESLAASRRAAEGLRARMVMAVSGPESVISDLEALASDRPFDEDVVELLVVALRDSGRRIDALQRIRRFQSQLIDALGIEPGARLAGLERDLVSVAFTDAELTTRSREPPIRRWSSSLVGRSRETEHLIELIGTHQLVTVVGPGGVGKTRLAVEVSNQGRQDRPTTLVDLTATVDPSPTPARSSTSRR
ncbi:MAG: BTAD domain-containing putative transcriptional regulator, partial [Actinomycetota bacterium]